jgi:hypothetical protein
MTDTPITQAVRDNGVQQETPGWVTWYTVGRRIFAQSGDQPDNTEDFEVAHVTVVENPEQVAQELVMAHNANLQRVQRPEFMRDEKIKDRIRYYINDLPYHKPEELDRAYFCEALCSILEAGGHDTVAQKLREGVKL